MKNSRSLGDCGFSFAVANVVIVFVGPGGVWLGSSFRMCCRFACRDTFSRLLLLLVGLRLGLIGLGL